VINLIVSVVVVCECDDCLQEEINKSAVQIKKKKTFKIGYDHNICKRYIPFTSVILSTNLETSFLHRL